MSKRVIRVCFSRMVKPAPEAHCTYKIYELEKLLAPYEVVIDHKAPDLLLCNVLDRDRDRLEATYSSAMTVVFSMENAYYYATASTESSIVKALLRYASAFSSLRRVFLFLGKWLILHYAPQRGWYRHFVLVRLRPYRLWPYKSFYQRLQRDVPSRYSIVSNAVAAKKYSLSLPFGIACMKWIRAGYEAVQPLSLKQKKFCCIIVSNVASIPRLHFFLRLSRYKQVDFYGHPALRNMDHTLPSGWTDIAKASVHREYKFVICFENSSAERYFTEKLVMALYADSVPLYWGDSCVGEYFNSERMIAYSDYKSFDAMIEKVIELDQDDTQYKEFVARPKQTPANLRHVAALWSSYEAFISEILARAADRCEASKGKT